MSLVLGIRRLLAAPVALVGRTLAMLSPPAGQAALELAWRIGRDGEVAVAALRIVQKLAGSWAAVSRAEVWSARQDNPTIAGYAGMTAMQEHGDEDSARAWLERGKQAGDDRTGMLEVLELILASRSGGQATRDLVDAWSERNDLSAMASRFVVTHRMWRDMAAGREDQAVDGAERLLSIDDDVQAAGLLWAVHTRRGRPDLAANRFARAGRLDRTSALAVQIQSARAAGLGETEDDLFAELARHDPEAAEQLRAMLDGEASA